MNIVPASVYLTDFSQENIQNKVVINSAEHEVQECNIEAVEKKANQETVQNCSNADFEESGLSPAEVSEKLAQQESYLDAKYKKEIQKLKIELTETLAQNVNQQFEQGLAHIESNVSNVVLNAIKPFVDSSVKNKIIADLVKTIESVSHDLKASVVLLSGTESKIESVKNLLENMGFEVSCIVTEEIEITLEIDDIWIETRFEEWETTLLSFSQVEARA